MSLRLAIKRSLVLAPGDTTMRHAGKLARPRPTQGAHKAYCQDPPQSPDATVVMDLPPAPLSHVRKK